MSLYRGFATVGGMTMLSRVLGFIRDVLMAAVLGAGMTADAFFVAFRVPNMFRRLFAEGAFDAAFVPLFAKGFEREGAAAAKLFAEQVLSGLTLVLVVFTLLGEVLMPWLVLLLAPGFAADPAKLSLTILLARIALPYLVCMSLVALYTGVLNALGRFALAALAPMLLNVVLIAILFGLIASDISSQPEAVIALAIGVAAAGLLQILVMAIAASHAKMHLNWRKPRLSPEMRKLIALAAPGFIAGSVAPLTAVIGTVVASLQERVVSWLYYADRLYQLPLGVIGAAVGVVLLPDLARKLHAGDLASVIESENRSLEFALALTLPAAVALFVASEPIVRVLFEHGAFTAVDAHATAEMLSAFALGLPAFVLIKVFHPSFFAREDTETPMLYAVIGMAANLVLSFILFVLVGAVGIALAASFAGWLHAGLLMHKLRSRREFKLDISFRRRLPRILLSTLCMGALVWGLTSLLDPWFAPGSGAILQVTALVLLVGTGLAAYAAAAGLSGAVQLKGLMAAFAQD